MKITKRQLIKFIKEQKEQISGSKPIDIIKSIPKKDWQFDDYGVRNADIDNDGSLDSNKVVLYTTEYGHDTITIGIGKNEGVFAFQIESAYGKFNYYKAFPKFQDAINHFTKILGFKPKFMLQK